jgi:hypothetical protein
MTLVPGLFLGFPQYARGVGETYTRRPLGRKSDTHKRHRIGVVMTRISLDLQKSVTLHHSRQPPTHATMVLQSPPSPHLGPCCEANKIDKKGPLRVRQYGSARVARELGEQVWLDTPPDFFKPILLADVTSISNE